MGGVWGCLCLAAIGGIYSVMAEGGGAILGAIFVGTIWGCFFGTFAGAVWGAVLSAMFPAVSAVAGAIVGGGFGFCLGGFGEVAIGLMSVFGWKMRLCLGVKIEVLNFGAIM
ncbi:hypothetical protein QUB56_05320 [Microcoleus sp. AR_TQ3_B6]|uniref:hypothetical protein n=1 Tax=Microcoleus sp. AR_TQ3_B6 TaxID=3055284 RepID=UPI002FD65F1E